MTAMMLGEKVLSIKKRRVGWEIWCLVGLALFLIVELFTIKCVKKNIAICNALHAFVGKNS